MFIKIYHLDQIRVDDVKSFSLIDNKNFCIFFKNSSSCEKFIKEIRKVSTPGLTQVNKFDLDKNYVSVSLVGTQAFPIIITP